jgi:putative protease
MEKEVGQVTHYFNRARVVVLELSGELSVGDSVHILGHTTDFTQQVESLEVEHKKIESAGPGDDVALKVIDRARQGDTVYKVTDE